MEQQGYMNLNNINNYNAENLIINGHYNAALYMRFSRDDGQAADSSSITTQRLMLNQHCQANGYKVFGEYIDDGYSGLNFERPDFQRMLTDIDEGKVNMVITKDLSRLGRDYIQTGYYSEIHFGQRNVRYIAINDGVDTLKADNDIAPFKNILNDMFAKDLSRKIKSAKRQRALNGLLINPQAPYGYKKDPDNKNRLAVDEEAAEVIRLIFGLALEGKGKNTIAQELTAKRILIPSAYKTKNGIRGFDKRNRHGKNDYDYVWKYTTVMTILRDRTYAGDLVNRKTEVLNYKTKKVTWLPIDKRIVHENRHEAIVSREDFDRVQALISGRHTPRRHDHENLFRGILFCAECGKRLVLCNQAIKTKGKASILKNLYRCVNHYNNPDECRHYNYIYYDDIFNQVSAVVRKAIWRISNDDGLLRTVQKRADSKSGNKKLVDEKAKIEKRLSALTTIVRKLYEDYATETLDEGNYRGMLAGYQLEQKTLKERLIIIDKDLSKVNDYEESYKKLKQFAAEYADCKELTAEMLKKLVERIEIEHPKKTDGKVTQQISIVYRFIQTSL